jgi:uncharacterized protein
MNIKIPTISECTGLMDQYGMLDNIRRHSFVVTRIAETITESLDLSSTNGSAPPDINLVRAGALLHDIAKTKCLDGSCRHAEEGQSICEEHGYADVGVIVREHVFLSSYTPEKYKRGYFPAREIVYYSDKRVRHEEIVPLSQRLEYIIERYGDGSDVVEQRIRDNFELCLELEDYLFSFLDFNPDDLAKNVLPIQY